MQQVRSISAKKAEKMSIRKTITVILVTIFALSFSACGAGPSPTVDPMDIVGTAQAAAFTMVAGTQAAMPTGTLLSPMDSSASLATSTPAFPPTPAPASLSTSTPVVLSDCFVSFHFAAWKDFDEDGLWDASEPPLAGVKFSPPARFAQVWGHPYLTEADGWLRIEAWSPGGCPEQEVTVTAVPPVSYEPTTPTSINLSLVSDDFSYDAQFGFSAVQ
jgi:hypothetical protein